jgi:hypothetical protein
MAGSYLGGSLTRLGNEVNYIAPFLTSVILTVFELLWLVFVLPESLPKKPPSQNLEQVEVRQDSLLYSAFSNIYSVFKGTVSVFLSENTSHTFLILIILSVTLALGNVPYLYLYTALKWQWTAFDIGRFIVVIAISRWYETSY